MKKIFIACVNYNTYEELYSYLKSIDLSASKSKDTFVEVVVADNSSIKKHIDCNIFKNINCESISLDNEGYLGAAAKIINRKQNIEDYDYVIISNVDILFHEDTIESLEQLTISKDVAWVAPNILSLKDGKNKNPNIMYRYSKLKLFLLKFTYNKLIYRLYLHFYYRKKKIRAQEFPEMEIYAGHGSCFILTSHFFEDYKKIKYPLFLYGEELFFAELIRIKNRKVLYVPSIAISDYENASTSKLPSQSYFEMNKKAINYIIKTFYD